MRRLFSLALALGVAVLTTAVQAETAWPTRPIKILVGYAAGGSTDVTARIIAQALSERLGQPVIIENRAGAGGNIAADAAAKADPDGYTLLMTTSTTFAADPSLYKTLPYNVQADFAPITLTAFIPNLLVVNPSVPAKNVAGIDRVPEGQSWSASISVRPATAPRSILPASCSIRWPASRWSTSPIAVVRRP